MCIKLKLSLLSLRFIFKNPNQGSFLSWEIDISKIEELVHEEFAWKVFLKRTWVFQIPVGKCSLLTLYLQLEKNEEKSVQLSEVCVCWGRWVKRRFQKTFEEVLGLLTWHHFLFITPGQSWNKNYALKIQMCVELSRCSNISPCKQYSKWVLTFLVVLAKLILTIGALNDHRTKSPYSVLPRKIYSIFFSYCSLVVRAEKEFSLCLPGTGDWEPASNWRQADVFHERTPRKWIPIPSFVRETWVMHEGRGAEWGKRWGEQGCCPWNWLWLEGQGWRRMNWQYVPLPFLFPLTCSPLDCRWHELGSWGWTRKEV